MMDGWHNRSILAKVGDITASDFITRQLYKDFYVYFIYFIFTPLTTICIKDYDDDLLEPCHNRKAT